MILAFALSACRLLPWFVLHDCDRHRSFALYNSFLLILYLLLHLLLLLSYCSPLWTLVSNTFLLHSFRSLTTVYWFFTPVIFRPSSTLSVHLFHGLPLFLIPSILAVTIFFSPFLRYSPISMSITSERFYEFLQVCPLVTYPVSSYLFLFSSIHP